MASRKNSKPADDLHIEELDDSLPEPRPSSAVRWASSNASAGKGASEALLFQSLGAIGLAGGLLLWAGAPFQSTLADAASALSSVSLHPSTLIVVGLLLFCFGRVRKSQVEQSRYLAGKDDGLLEQVAATQVHTRNALEKLAHNQSSMQSSSHSTMEEHHRVLRHDLQQIVAATARTDEDAAAQEAIFRLAASLDQLGARVEQRIQAQHETFQAGLQQIGSEILAAQNDLRELIAQLPAALPAAPPSDPFSEPLPQGEPTAEEAPPAERPQPQRATPRPAPLSSEPINSLGVLDNIPDESAALPSPVRRVPQGTFSSEPAPKGSIVKESSPLDRALELDTHTKLTQLSDLLADDRLRAALEDMRRNG